MAILVCCLFGHLDGPLESRKYSLLHKCWPKTSFYYINGSFDTCVKTMNKFALAMPSSPVFHGLNHTWPERILRSKSIIYLFDFDLKICSGQVWNVINFSKCKIQNSQTYSTFIEIGYFYKA